MVPACLTKSATVTKQMMKRSEAIEMIVLPKSESELPAIYDSISYNDSYAEVENSFESLVEEISVMSQTERTRRHRHLRTMTASDPEMHGTVGDASEGT